MRTIHATHTSRILLRTHSTQTSENTHTQWEYGYPYYMDALQYLQELQEDGAIRHLALTNFDTKHMAQVHDDGIRIVSNQVQYSILDQRPDVKMAPAAAERGIQILAYGTLLGGFFSEKWLGQAEPRGFETVSQQKVRGFGGFHDKKSRVWRGVVRGRLARVYTARPSIHSPLSNTVVLSNDPRVGQLAALPGAPRDARLCRPEAQGKKTHAHAHTQQSGARCVGARLHARPVADVSITPQVSIPNVAVRWVLDQPAVGGAIVGVRFGLKGKEHLDDNSAVFKFVLDAQDKEDIAAVTRRGNDLFKAIGDCGDEYRRA